MAMINKNDGLLHNLLSFEKMFYNSLHFLKPDPKYGNEILKSLGFVNEVIQGSNTKINFRNTSDQLVTKDMNDCQIWQQIELSNSGFMEDSVEKLSFLLSYNSDYLKIVLKDSRRSEISLNTSKTKAALPRADVCNAKGANRKKKQIKKSLHKSIVENHCFKLNKMEEFLLTEEAKEIGNIEQKTLDIDYFVDDFTASFDKRNLTYKQFFNGEIEHTNFEDYPSSSSFKTKKNYKISTESNDSIPESCIGTNTSQSSYKIKQQQLEKLINQYEAAVLGEKFWQMEGEVPASKRPKNSLLEELLEFDPMVTPAPVVTEKTSKCIESIIIHRIKNKIWDDMVRIVEPANTTGEYNRHSFNDQEKPRKSLTAHYENQYSAAMEQLTSPTNKNFLEKTLKGYPQLKKELQDLFLKLDTLSEFHLSVQPVAPEATILLHTPSVETEECTPFALNKFGFFKPEEIYCKTNELVGKTERSLVQKNRDFRTKKVRISTRIGTKNERD